MNDKVLVERELLERIAIGANPNSTITEMEAGWKGIQELREMLTHPIAAQSAPDEREAFESWLPEHYWLGEMEVAVEGDEYANAEVQVAWEVWQARAAWQRAQSAPVVPDGWRLVPVEPTDAMLAAYEFHAIAPMGPISVYGYRAMLAAAPQPAARQEQGDEVRRLREALEKARHAVDRADYSTGVCCCGSSVASHGLGDGHSPVDEGDYFKLNVLKDIDAALSASAEGK